MNDDARDLQAAREGGEEAQRAFARLYDRHSAVVLSVCRQHLPVSAGLTTDDAEDALQEAFVRAYRLLDRLDAPDKFRPWIYSIARLVCAERRRAAKRRRTHEHEVLMTQRTAPPPPSTAAPAEHADDLARLSRALESLPDNERLAIHLYYLDADPTDAAASALGVSRSGFYKLLTRARERLAGLMKEAQVS